ncbi:MAG: Gfo/Idh/MocA family protein [Opitutales bacterium]
METVRIGIIGAGGMGGNHARLLQNGEIKGAVLAGIADISPKVLDRWRDVGNCYDDASQMIRSGTVDAVIIATPHYPHTTYGIEALQAGLHTLVEKPISVHKADCERLIAAHTDKSKVFCAMFNQRTNGAYQKIRSLVQSGELGRIQRIQWTITDWFRTDAYYAHGGWRATWAGEGGGVLLNQCPHQLDLWQWMFGMPDRVRAFCHFGKYHDIEVEDEVTAYMEYDSGATGVFITTTGEAPGVNRLEVATDRGIIQIGGGADGIQFKRNEIPTSQWISKADERFGKPPVWDVKVPTPPLSGGGHKTILQNFTDAITQGADLLAPAEEGIHSVELGNSMLLSAWENDQVTVPIDAKRFESLLKEKITGSRYDPEEAARKMRESESADLKGSF